VKAETPQERQKRLGPQIGARAKVVGAFVKQMKAETQQQGNPYLEKAADITDPAELRRKLSDRSDYLDQVMTSPKSVKGGKIDPAVASTLRKAYLEYLAWGSRLKELAEKAHLDAVERHGYFHPIAEKAQLDALELKM
jgi:hypothetical protein